MRLLGNQDTVYLGNHDCGADGQNCIPARQYFSDCYVEGNVDLKWDPTKLPTPPAQ